MLDGSRNTSSAIAGSRDGKWPVRVNPDDVRAVFFQDPADNTCHQLEWEHAALLGTPFSGEAARYARRLPARAARWPDAGQALRDLLERWDKGAVAGRRERRMAARLAAERAAISWQEPGSTTQETPE